MLNLCDFLYAIISPRTKTVKILNFIIWSIFLVDYGDNWYNAILAIMARFYHIWYIRKKHKSITCYEVIIKNYNYVNLKCHMNSNFHIIWTKITGKISKYKYEYVRKMEKFRIGYIIWKIACSWCAKKDYHNFSLRFQVVNLQLFPHKMSCNKSMH